MIDKAENTVSYALGAGDNDISETDNLIENLDAKQDISDKESSHSSLYSIFSNKSELNFKKLSDGIL